MSIKHMMQAALMTAVIIVLGLIPGIPLGFIPVPIVLQNVGILLAGELFGIKRGTISVWLFELLVVLGMPFLSGGNGGFAVFLGPTAGYLIIWLFTPALVGGLIKLTNATNSWWREWLAVWIAGVVVMNVFGASWLAIQNHLSLSAAAITFLTFIPGDTIKSLLAVVVARRLRRVKRLD
ncbi:biotin transporter BioY [Lentilactobacillus curieae]|uniref:Biotin transporter n=1 Tax=Lentilactobacillus curieae TaxID=1138822 RepID=A0A1S6QIP2_9LACO|nr:biotin transporter BioY [Lentilactobacillus curieae]AQW21478.1 biotin transporter BioY [Lentilactobacillus curieae]